MKIAVRLDDITPDMDWERFYAFKALLDKYQVKPLIGVVPDNRDDNLKGSKEKAPDDFWEYIKELQTEGWCVAMHGFRHIYSTSKGGIFPLNNFSEFAGVSYEKQLEMLSMGRKMLLEKGIDTDIFMAPAHSYDKNTLKALKEVGFKSLTDGFGDGPYEWKGLSFYPISFMLSRTLKKKSGYSTLVVHTGTITDEEYKGYESYFENKNVEWISYKEYLAKSKEKRSFVGMTIEYAMAKTKFMIVNLKNKCHG